MKHLYLTFTGLIASFAVMATVRNVSNAPNAPVNPPYTYNALQDAIDASADGDSIYLHGTNVSYGNVTISNKTIVIIGAGYGNNLQNSSNQPTVVGTITFADYDGIKNVSLIGLRMGTPRSGSNAANKVNTLYIERCGMSTVGSGYDPNNNAFRCNTLFFKQSVIGDLQYIYTPFAPTVLSTAYFSNSVIQGDYNGNATNSAVFENCIFKRMPSGYGTVTNFGGNAVFNNNIFFNSYGLGSVSGCTFNNNLFEHNQSLSGQNAANNIVNTPAGLVNNAGPTSHYGRGDFSTGVDYRLAPGSSCIGAGIGGTDLGIYGGTNPIPAAYPINGVPAMPRITQMTIQNMSVAPGGNLNVQIQAVNQD